MPAPVLAGSGHGGGHAGGGDDGAVGFGFPRDDHRQAEAVRLLVLQQDVRVSRWLSRARGRAPRPLPVPLLGVRQGLLGAERRARTHGAAHGPQAVRLSDVRRGVQLRQPAAATRQAARRRRRRRRCRRAGLRDVTGSRDRTPRAAGCEWTSNVAGCDLMSNVVGCEWTSNVAASCDRTSNVLRFAEQRTLLSISTDRYETCCIHVRVYEILCDCHALLSPGVMDGTGSEYPGRNLVSRFMLTCSLLKWPLSTPPPV